MIETAWWALTMGEKTLNEPWSLLVSEQENWNTQKSMKNCYPSIEHYQKGDAISEIINLKI